MNFITSPLQTLANNYKILWKPIALEILFLLLFGFISSPFTEGIGNNLLQIGDQIVLSSADIQADVGEIIFSSQNTQNIFLLGGILSVITYLLYSFFHGYLWSFSLSLSEKTTHGTYIKKFFLVNILWFLFFTLFTLINFMFSYFDRVARRFDEGFAFFGNLTYILLVVILYFAFISYILIKTHSAKEAIKKSFELGFTKIQSTKIFVSMIIFSVLYYIVGGLDLISNILFIIVGILVIPLTLLWLRLSVKEIIEEVQ